MPRDLYQEVTDTIIAELEKGAAPWVRPWRSAGEHHNAITKRPYRGINALLLWIEAQNKGYQHTAWLTYKQAKEAGGHVRKGEKSTLVVLWKPFDVTETDEETGEEKTETRWILRAFNVFNVSQCDGLNHVVTEAEPRPVISDPEFEAWVARTGAKVRHGANEAYYAPAIDEIHMPHHHCFKSSEHYAATLLHELGHWTGHESRLNRQFSKRFGDHAYAAEELVAELTAAYLCADMGIKNGDLRHAGYINHWLKLLRNDKRAIFTAASQAQKAADYLKSAADAEKRLAA